MLPTLVNFNSIKGQQAVYLIFTFRPISNKNNYSKVGRRVGNIALGISGIADRNLKMFCSP